MSLQSQWRDGEKIRLSDYWNYWIYTRHTLAEKLGKEDSDIINVVLTVQGTWNGSTVNINLDGTSSTVYRGAIQYYIAGNLIITDTLEIPLKKENMTVLEGGPITLWGRGFNTISIIKMIEKSASALTPQEALVKARSVILTSDGANTSLFLELPRPQSGLWTILQ